MCGWDACRRELCRRMCSLDEAERSIHTIAHPRLTLEYLSLRPCRRAAYIRRKPVETISAHFLDQPRLFPSKHLLPLSLDTPL